MNNHLDQNKTSCAVALHIDRNYATKANGNTTSVATHDLLALSTRVLERNKRNQKRNSSATSRLRYISENTHMLPGQDNLARNELKKLIQQVGHYYKASEMEVEEMFQETLIYHPMDVALSTFRILLEKCRQLDHLYFAGNLQEKDYV